MNLFYTNFINNFTYLGSRVRHDNGGRGHSYAYTIYLTYRRPRINAAPNKGDSAFTQRIIKKNLVLLGNLHHSDNYNSILAKKV